MDVRSRRIFGPTALGTGYTVLYTVPAGRTLIIRGLQVTNYSAGAQTFQFTVNGTTNPTAVWNDSVPTGRTSFAPREMVLDAGDVLRGVASANNALVVLAGGSVLLGVWS